MNTLNHLLGTFIGFGLMFTFQDFIYGETDQLTWTILLSTLSCVGIIIVGIFINIKRGNI